MTEREKISMIAGQVEADVNDEKDMNRMLACLDMARWAILNRMYPFGIPDGVDSVPKRYDLLHAQVAIFYWSKKGMEGESSHSENGMVRVFGGADVPEALMRQITPKGKVM